MIKDMIVMKKIINMALPGNANRTSKRKKCQIEFILYVQKWVILQRITIF
jgi:hypothetical protein